MASSFPRGIAIAGVGDLDYSALYRERDIVGARDPYDLAIQASRNALADAGLPKEAIDGVLCVRDVHYEYFCSKFGLRRPRFVNYLIGEGRQSGLAVQYAAMAVASGLAECVLVIYSNNGRTRGEDYGSEGQGADPYGLLHGMTSPGAQVASMFNRYRHDFGCTPEQLGQVAVSSRHHATLNERAVFRTPLTMDDYLNSRYITEPLRLFDYCLINDGAVALIVTTTERARDLRAPVVELMATASCGDVGASYASDDFFYGASQRAARDLHEQSGLTVDDVDCVQVYNNFAPAVLFGLEGFGYCGRGEAGPYAETDGLTLGSSRRPVNTSGAHTSESYMQGFNLHVEAVRQLRGECGPRQVPDCKVVQYICPSPIVTSHLLARA